MNVFQAYLSEIMTESRQQSDTTYSFRFAYLKNPQNDQELIWSLKWLHYPLTSIQIRPVSRFEPDSLME